MEIDLGPRVVAYELKRSSRARWARLEVHVHRGVRVVLPARAPEADAEKFIRTKSRWLLRHLAKVERLRTVVPDRRFVSGERIPCLDESLTLEVKLGPPNVERQGSILAVSLPVLTERSVRWALEKWFRLQAEVEFARRVDDVASRFGIAIRGTRISRAKTRWGSCSPTGWIRINWRMMLAPSTIAEYLIAHELSHVGHFNHSKAFWSRVAELYPEYAEAEKWLRKNGQSLVL